MSTNIHIQSLYRESDYLRCEALQREIWGFADREIVPLNELVVIQRYGGIVLGAFHESQAGEPDAEDMVGFVWGFTGLSEGKPIHCSRMLGVLSRSRGLGIGYRLKLRQREEAIALGVTRMVWTFEPLSALNAHFNLVKLGAVARQYLVHLYSGSTSRFNAGWPSDRLVAEWDLTRPLPPLPGGRETRSITENLEGKPTVNRVEVNAQKEPVPVSYDDGLQDPVLLVEIPAEVFRLKDRNPELARTWRSHARQVLRSYLLRGYVVTTLHHVRAPSGIDGGGFRCLYRLAREGVGAGGA